MKKGVFLKVRLLHPREYKRLSRLLKIRLGCGDLDNARSIFRALEESCINLDSKFKWDLCTMDILGGYNPETHTILLTPETYDLAWKGCKSSLFTIVHEIAHWAMVTLYGIKHQTLLFELPLCFRAEEECELYANTFACYLMLPQVMTMGGKGAVRLFKRSRNKSIYLMSLRELNVRRKCRAIGFKQSWLPSQGKKTA